MRYNIWNEDRPKYYNLVNLFFFFFPIDHDLQQLNQDPALAHLLSPVIYSSRLMQRIIALLLEMEWWF